MKIFKVTAEGDTLYIKAKTKVNAEKQLFKKIGEIPADLLRWSEVTALPKGEQFL